VILVVVLLLQRRTVVGLLNLIVADACCNARPLQDAATPLAAALCIAACAARCTVVACRACIKARWFKWLTAATKPMHMPQIDTIQFKLPYEAVCNDASTAYVKLQDGTCSTSDGSKTLLINVLLQWSPATAPIASAVGCVLDARGDCDACWFSAATSCCMPALWAVFLMPEATARYAATGVVLPAQGPLLMEEPCGDAGSCAEPTPA
jgi:hypothetical protein